MPNRKPLLLLLAILLLSLAACETAPSSPSACPPVVEYDAEFLSRAADELDSVVAEGSTALPQMIVDYGQLRAMLRVCR